MKLETIYKRIKENITTDDVIKWEELLEDINKEIRLQTSYKTSNKTRVNAIKRVADKKGVNPVLGGYGILEDYKVVTDSYHLIMIHEENLPLKLVTSDEELIDKVGKENCICGNYPNVSYFKSFDKSVYKTIELDFDEIQAYYKIHKSNSKDEPIKIDNYYYDVVYLKNLIDVLGTDIKVYVPIDNEYKPLYIENNNDELGLVLPVKNIKLERG